MKKIMHPAALLHTVLLFGMMAVVLQSDFIGDHPDTSSLWYAIKFFSALWFTNLISTRIVGGINWIDKEL